LLHDVVEPENVAQKKLTEMRGGFVETMNLKKFAHQAHVGAAGELHIFRPVMEIEFRGKSFGKRFRSRAARVDKRAVNVEQNEPNHAARKLIAAARGGNELHRFWL
jgi:hypothetical protein